MSGLFLYKSFEMPKINDKRADGFTLVELAIVMIIIGLLIGGVLKGQELIANAQVTSTVAQIKGIEAAALTFRDQYQALPGDMSRATVRLPNCTAPCVNGNGDDRLNIIAGITAESEGENIQFWVHMNKADVFSGVDGTTQPSWGEGMPKADVGGGFGVSFSSGDLVGATSAINARGGHYLSLKADPANVASTASHLRASIAARLDRKMDDGAPNSGTVRAAAAGSAANTVCVTGSSATAQYNEATDPIGCALYIRIQ